VKAITVACLICLAASAPRVEAQRRGPAPCPAVQLSGPEPEEYNGLPLIFATNVDGYEGTYKWSVSGAKIIGGQGTGVITVKFDEDTFYHCLSVTVEADELGAECPRTATWQSLVVVPHHPWWKLDEYVDFSPEDEKARLDQIGMYMRPGPGSRLRIVGHDGPNRRNEKAARRIKRARDYLIKKHGIDPALIVLGPREGWRAPRTDSFAIEIFSEPVKKTVIPRCEEKR